ncbi:hypothetical protein [Lacrimispora sp. 210928-DFI.3.58]|uniref:hypothetical protein n=1 Tax=Lacrimispora sp. 210928-DFI.3.58 TaxID=2883214 RepID=UPI001D07C2FF|nr:hypothetical protein [Lacrimispora sp. 210928-DFI.3.58]MCB7321271.1 hypothetical protein [Lacrimispora sp. 210928-DFI.3.58]
MREIKIPIAAYAELLVHVTEEMEKDYRDCAAKAGVIGGDGKDCETCSWWGQDIGGYRYMPASGTGNGRRM